MDNTIKVWLFDILKAIEDLTAEAAYNLNHLNQYARVLGCVPADLVFARPSPKTISASWPAKRYIPTKLFTAGSEHAFFAPQAPQTPAHAPCPKDAGEMVVV